MTPDQMRACMPPPGSVPILASKYVPITRERADGGTEPALCWEFDGKLLVHPQRLVELEAAFKAQDWTRLSVRDMQAIIRAFSHRRARQDMAMEMIYRGFPQLDPKPRAS